MGISNVSIINQPLPDIPQQAQHSHSQRNPQPLSASNLDQELLIKQYRSKPVIRSEFDSNSLKYSHNTRTRTAQIRPTSQAHTQTLKHSSTSMATNVPMSMVQPPPLPQKVDQPPMLPPKNKNKSDKTTLTKSALKQNQKQHQTHSGVSAPPPQKIIKPTEHARYMGEQQHQHQHQPTAYSTFGHDYTRENRRYARENVRESAPKSSSYSSREYHAEPTKSSSRHQATSTGTSTTTPHRSAKDHSHGMIDPGRMSDCQYPYDASQHRQYSQHADHHGTSTYPHRSRMADESHHTYRTTETNRRNYNRDRGDTTDLTGKVYCTV